MIIANVFDACVREKLSHRITIISSKKTTNRIPGRLQTNDQIVAHWALCRYVKDNKYFNVFFFRTEFGHRKGVFIRCCVEDLHRHRLFAGGYAELRALLRHDRRCHRPFVNLQVCIYAQSTSGNFLTNILWQHNIKENIRWAELQPDSPQQRYRFVPAWNQRFPGAGVHSARLQFQLARHHRL